MIEITIKLIPRGDYSKQKLLYKAHIANDATGSLKRGNYECIFLKKGSDDKVWKRARVVNFPRKSLNVWHLLFRALKVVLVK